ncbi:hypothetical protein BC829DRAFT_449439 [Chytridium lagenaria]|nr:hypothetical protein BC829DRAFT_449439 [Chytridium lagenaria]
MARPRLHLLITLFLILTFAAWAHPRTFHNNPAIGAGARRMVQRKGFPAPSSGGWGLDVWSSTAVGLRKMFKEVVCLITGSRGSAYLTTSITTLNETITVIPSNIRASLQRVPAVIDETVARYRLTSTIRLITVWRDRGELLMEGFKMLTDLVVAFAKNTTDVNEYAGTIGNNSDAFNRDLLFLNRNITLLNSIFNSTSNRTLRFELRTKLPSSPTPLKSQTPVSSSAPPPQTLSPL